MEESKICNVCKRELPVNEFCINTNQCKHCKREKEKIWREKNKEKVKAYEKSYYQDNKEKKLNYQNSYHIKNRTKMLSNMCNYRNDDKNKKRISKQKMDWVNKQLKEDIQFKLRHILRGRIYNALNDQLTKKSNSTIELLGCDCEFYKKYIELLFTEGMTWDNYGEWHIDHIKPCASFDLTNINEQKLCFHYTNTQPLWAFDNLSKGAKIEFPCENSPNQLSAKDLIDLA